MGHGSCSSLAETPPKGITTNQTRHLENEMENASQRALSMLSPFT